MVVSERKYNLIKFKACKYLDFDQRKCFAKLVRISDHVGWERIDSDGKPQLCQLCSKRGRLNNPEDCIKEENRACSDYELEDFSFGEITYNV